MGTRGYLRTWLPSAAAVRDRPHSALLHPNLETPRAQQQRPTTPVKPWHSRRARFAAVDACDLHRAHPHRHTHLWLLRRTSEHVSIHPCMHPSVRPSVRPSAHPPSVHRSIDCSIERSIHTHTHTCMHARTHACTRAHAYTHTRTPHEHAHTTCFYMYMLYTPHASADVLCR